MPEASDEEAVRIFVEFDRIDSAIKGKIRNLTLLYLNSSPHNPDS